MNKPPPQPLLFHLSRATFFTMMMDKLPPETFTSIIQHLDMRDKFQCAIVSPKWNLYISTTALYETVRLDGNDSFYKTFVFFDSRRHLSATVKNITLRNVELEAYSIFSLPRLFPNVKHFDYCGNDQDRQEESDNLYNDGLFYPPELLCNMAFQKWNKIEV